MANLKQKFNKEMVPALQEKLGMNNVMAVPRLKKVVTTKARKSVASFKIREGYPIGCKVTLRGERMYDFIERLINIAIPRERDFRGLNPKSFDGQGNYSFGIKEQIIFPEINYDNIDKVRGLNITICTTAKSNEDGLELLRNFNMPFTGNESI